MVTYTFKLHNEKSAKISKCFELLSCWFNIFYSYLDPFITKYVSFMTNNGSGNISDNFEDTA